MQLQGTIRFFFSQGSRSGNPGLWDVAPSGLIRSNLSQVCYCPIYGSMMSSPIQTLRSSHRTISINLSIFSQGLLLLLLVSGAFILMTAHTSAQDTKTRTTTAGLSVSVFTYKEIPAATGPCTSEECDWWNRLREAGNKL